MDAFIHDDTSSQSSSSSSGSTTIKPICRPPQLLYSYNAHCRYSTMALMSVFPTLFETPFSRTVQIFFDLDAHLVLPPKQLSADHHLRNSFKRALLRTYITSFCARSHAFHDELTVMCFQLVFHHIGSKRALSAFSKQPSFAALATCVNAYHHLLTHIELNFPSLQLRHHADHMLYKHALQPHSKHIARLCLSVDRHQNGQTLALISAQLRRANKKTLLKSVQNAYKALYYSTFDHKYAHLLTETTPSQVLSIMLDDYCREVRLLKTLFGASDCERLSHSVPAAMFGQHVCDHVNAHPEMWRVALNARTHSRKGVLRRMLIAMMPDVMATLKRTLDHSSRTLD